MPMITELQADGGTHLKGFDNGGNTCYISSVLFALFGKTDAWDYLLLPNRRHLSTDQRSVLNFLRESIVNPLRSGKLITADTIDTFRSLFRLQGWEADPVEIGQQQDALEFYLKLMEVLGAPMLAQQYELFHGGKSVDRDNGLESGYTIEVAIDKDLRSDPSFKHQSGESFGELTKRKLLGVTNPNTVCLPPGNLEDFVKASFESNALEGINRCDSEGTEIKTSGWRMLRLLSEPVDLESSGCSEVAQTSMIIPIVLKRYCLNTETRRLERLHRAVRIPEIFDFSSFIAGHYIGVAGNGPQGKQWTLMDDMRQYLGKVKHGSSISKVIGDFDTTAYILFYELTPAPKTATGEAGITDYEFSKRLDAHYNKGDCFVS